MIENKKYNLFTAIAMVVGIVVGSGVFFKASSILKATSGNLGLSLLAWLLGGAVMIVSAYAFSLIASKSNDSDLVGMAEESVGRKHSYIVSWYMGVIYYPLLCGILGWVCGNFTCILLGIDSSLVTIILSFVYVISIYSMNTFAPKVAGYFQVTTASVKVVPLIIMAIGGIIFGIFHYDGTLIQNFTSSPLFSNSSGFMKALCATCFAYEGWICATSISKELKNPKRDLPKALIIGTILVLVIYMTYFIGLAGTYPNSDFVQNGDSQILAAFSKLLGNQVFGSILYVFVIISCVGTLNGLAIGTTRSFKAIADKNNGPNPELFKTINKFGMNTYSVIMGFVLALVWLIIWLVMVYYVMENELFFAMDISELVCVFVYVLYVPMYINMIKNRSDLNKVNRFVVPILAICASGLMIVAGVLAHGFGCLLFLIIAIIILVVGMKFYKEGEVVESTN
ncbi:MAG: APC family permease [bacterium]